MNLMKPNRFLRLTAAVLSALLLAGCTLPGTDPTSPTGQSTVPTQPTVSTGPTAPTQTEPPETDPTVPTQTEPTETQPTEPPPSLDPASKMTATQWKSSPVLQSLGGGIVLASRPRYNYGKLETSLELIDVYSDKVTAMEVLSGVYEPVGQRFADGAIVMGCDARSSFFVYNDALQLQQTIPVPNIRGYFSYDRQRYYCVEDGALYRMDTASGNRGRLALQWDLRLAELVGIHPRQELLIAQVYLSCYTDIWGIAVIDGKTGQIRLLSDRLSSLSLTEDRFYGRQMNDQAYGYDVIYGSMAGGDALRLTPQILGGEGVQYTSLPDSGYLMRLSALPEDTPAKLYDLTNGAAVCDLSAYGVDKPVQGAIYLPDEQLIVGYYQHDKAYYRPIRLDPKVLTFTASGSEPEPVTFPVLDQAVADRYTAEVEGPALPGELDTVRDLADQLEAQFGVKILLSTQTQATCAHIGLTAATADDPALITGALQVLKAALSKYPGGFLEQFRNEAHGGGLYFSLTGKLQDPLDPVGYAAPLMDRYNVVVDITNAALEKAIHHEIWHAIEMRVSVEAFGKSQWNACNPKEFRYTEHYDKSHLTVTKWTLTGGSGSHSYFVDGYAQINAREDRARILEYVMTEDAEALLKAEPLRQKLTLMSQVIRAHFNTDGWTNVYWETGL